MALVCAACLAASVISMIEDFATSVDHSPPGSSVHDISWVRILEWVVMPFSRGSSQHRD